MAVYKKAVKKEFTFLKKTQNFDDLLAKSIVFQDKQCYLVPVCELHTTDEQLISQLAQWRIDNSALYPSQSQITIEGTKQWLRNSLLNVEDRILFLVLDPYGNRIGHLGFANGINEKYELELDNVVRGIQGSHPGIMSNAVKALFDWAKDTLGCRSFYLRTFSDNHKAIAFYKKLGFKEDKLIPLRRHEEGESVYYRDFDGLDQAEPDKYFLRMVYAPKIIIDGSNIILTAGSSMSAREVSYVVDAVRYGWNHKFKDYINKFENSFAEYLGVKYALNTSHCTHAMHLALATLEIGPGDEVIVPDITWVATADAVLYVGATPIFADVELDSWCLDPVSFESKITDKTKAVMPVHLYGHPARMDKIMEIARRHNLYVVEDAAPAIGAECQGQKVGTFGDFAAYSFQGAKLLVTGEGGMLVTNNEELYKKAWALWNMGTLPGTFWATQKGYKYRMSNIQAALGLGQLERVDELIEAKRRIFSWYDEGLKDVPHVKLNYETNWARSIYWMSSIFLEETAGVTRDQLREELKKRNVDTRPVFPAISQYPFWNKPQTPQPTALRVGNQAINLPSGVCLKREEVDYICQCLQEILGQG
ncbi:MAG: GNAT family N-acetyltransferase [Oscillatoriales cyanobacterium]|nr:MAG: GNAT family N-acetyltransferase [Oscillatoriales cyanobacterium]TAG74148.1 MAG: GNAT family N-acetyltransferase [Oscillatoriales cyanobacterium]